MIERIPFGRTGHLSSRTIFGAACLGAMSQSRADHTLALADEAGLNHIDVAASYGDAELRLAPFLKTRRKDFFLATKTGDRTGPDARASLERSLTRMGVDQVDLIQMHNLVEESDWATAMGPGGALEALIHARDEGLTRFIGVTGHGTTVAAMHLRSLEQFDFDSVLLPYSFAMNSQADYSSDFEALAALCQERDVAMQTIKSVARRRWAEDATDPKYSWYQPLTAAEPIARAVHYVLARPGLFLNTSSDARLLPHIVAAAQQETVAAPTAELLAADVAQYGIEPLFVRGQSDRI